jgi:hypothetical protein
MRPDKDTGAVVEGGRVREAIAVFDDPAVGNRLDHRVQSDDILPRDEFEELAVRDELAWFVVLDLTREPIGPPRAVPRGGLSNAALTRDNGLPRRLDVGTRGRQAAISGNDDSVAHASAPTLFGKPWAAKKKAAVRAAETE